MKSDKYLTRAAAGIFSLPLAVLAQHFLDQERDSPLGWWFLGGAALLFLLGFARYSVDRADKSQESGSPTDRPWGLLVANLGALASLSSYAFFGGNRLTLLGLVLWQGGLVVFIGGMAGIGGLRDRTVDLFRRWRSMSLYVTPSMVMVMLITLVGAFFRLGRVADLPAEPGVDLPLIFMSIEKVLDGEWPIFLTYHPGREALYIYLAAAYVKLFGLSFPALRTVGALIGTITVPAVYWLGHKLANRRVGLVAAAFLALSRWHVILSRTGLRYILMPLFSILLAGAMHRALQSRRRWHWVWVGVVLGCGFHTYNAWIIMPGLVMGGCLLYRLAHRDWRREDAVLLLIALATAALLFVPLARFAHDDPQMFTMRVASRLTSREAPLPSNLVDTIWKNIGRTAGMFNGTGDGVAWSNVPLKRQLGWVSGALFVPGFLYLLARWRQHSVLLLSLVLTCLPSTLALAFPHEVPNAGRASGAIGFACVTAAVPFVLWWQNLPRLLPKRLDTRCWRSLARIVLSLVLLGALLLEGLETRVDYFDHYRMSIDGANYPISTRIVETIERFDQGGKVYLKGFPHFYDGNALRTQLRLAGLDWENEILELTPGLCGQLAEEGPLVVILHPQDSEAITLLKATYPEAAVFAHYDNHKQIAFLSLIASPK